MCLVDPRDDPFALVVVDEEWSLLAMIPADHLDTVVSLLCVSLPKKS